MIDSLNDDKPYDRFVAEQIAGDVLYPGDPQATVATGFIAAGPWDFVGHVELREGTVDKEIARSNDRDDMVANAMSTFVQPDGPLRPLPRSQVRPDPAGGLLRACRPSSPASIGPTGPTISTRRRRPSGAELAARKLRAEKQLAAVRENVAADHQPRDRRDRPRTRACAEANWPALPAEKPSQTNGYHSEIAPTPRPGQVGAGRSGRLAVDRRDRAGAGARRLRGHPGPGFGFPARFQVEVSDDVRFSGRSDRRRSHRGRLSLIRATRRFASDRRAPRVATSASRPRGSGSGRTITSSRWPSCRSSRTDKTRPAARRSRRSTRSRRAELGHDEPGRRIQQPPARCRRPTALRRRGGKRSPRRSRPANAAPRCVDELTDPATRAELAELERDSKGIDARFAELPKPQMVYAATPQFTAQGSFKRPTSRATSLSARTRRRAQPRRVGRAGGRGLRAGSASEFRAARRRTTKAQRRAALAHGSPIRATC